MIFVQHLEDVEIELLHISFEPFLTFTSRILPHHLSAFGSTRSCDSIRLPPLPVSKEVVFPVLIVRRSHLLFWEGIRGLTPLDVAFERYLRKAGTEPGRSKRKAHLSVPILWRPLFTFDHCRRILRDCYLYLCI
jgi:hypothetical protein